MLHIQSLLALEEEEMFPSRAGQSSIWMQNMFTTATYPNQKLQDRLERV
jgi:hypothetical protein